MNEIHKQRLVGGLILVALGVIFWPIIFVQSNRDAISDIGEMPSRPAVPSLSIAPPSDEGLRFSEPSIPIEDDEQEVDIGLPPSPQLPIVEREAGATDGSTSEHEPRDERPENLTIDADGIPIAWTLQVATLSSKVAADKLLEELLARDHKAYIAKITRNAKTLYRVCIGPQFEKIQLQRLKSDVDARYDVKSLVARYIP
ncbi:MAG: SPOR domain-containing protein [Halioglobus sp.]|nr:SPOR domain-containing protein [Halioglobus sp.]